MKRKIAILTKSSRHGHYCVVGYDIDNCELIRLVSSDIDSQGSVTKEHMRCSNGQMASVLDVVEVDIIQKVPTELHPEDLLFDEKTLWKNLGKYKISDLPQSIYCKDEFIFADTSVELTLDVAKQIKKSIIIVKVQNMSVYKNYSKTKAAFDYNGNRYVTFSVTDEDFYSIETLNYESAILIVTLPNDKWSYNNNRFFKFIAKIYPEN